MKIHLHINFHTQPGQNLAIVVEGNEERPYEMTWQENGDWTAEIDHFSKTISYRYLLTDTSGNVLDTELSAHHLTFPHSYSDFDVYDVWNRKNFPENYLNNKILKNSLQNFRPAKVQILKKHTHHFRLEAPVYNENWQVMLLGSAAGLGEWAHSGAVPMVQTAYGVWEAAVRIDQNVGFDYKYGLRDTLTGEIFDIEYGDNRWAFPNTEAGTLQIRADHFFRFKSFEMYHAAGVAVPVFSLRSEEGFGVGEFRDLKRLGDWARASKLSVLQILPINDTTANYSWTDSYPYAAISVYALHPQYLSIADLNVPLPELVAKEFDSKRKVLNALEHIDYEHVIAEKWSFLNAVFDINKEEILKDRQFKKFLRENEEWLLPYSAFCVLRDLYNTPDFTQWKTHKKYIAGKVAAFFSVKNKHYEKVMLHAWVQYQLHLQLTEAIDYLHTLGISVKGDLPIGIYRHSVEAWTEPELFGMDFQAGAPPDQFTDLGQNWGFPTYNWEKMKADGYRWWKNRFRALEQYFDAMRIDHILGFFRIWRMPLSDTQGILGYFYPAVPVRLAEFEARHIPFEEKRYCAPFINDQILWDFFGEQREAVQNQFLENHFNGLYSFKENFDTQRKLADFFLENNADWPQESMLALAANVLFLKEERDGETVFHPRFNLHKTDSYKYLGDWEKEALYDLYNDYFFHRQDALWAENALEKLPVILNATDMLICGEDLGLVPECVPQVMDQLAITALKVQRMPAENIAWYDPKNAGYMNVVTASSHDSSTLRQWWHEDRELVQNYFRNQLHQPGTAPWNLEPELAEIIMKQHLYNDAMLAIFPLQEFLATDSELANPKPENERINDPAVFPHYWRYRMHLPLENLLKHENFSNKIAAWVQDSGRAQK